MRRALLAALAALLLGPAPAPAQSAGAPVVGGGSFATAPLLEPGRYRDTILPGERLYYGIRLEPGQRLRVEAKLDVPSGTIDNDTADSFSVGLQTPLREVVVDIDDDIAGNNTVADAEDRIDVVFPAVLAGSGAREESGNYTGPGVWYPSLYLISSEQRPDRVEFPVDFELEVIGDPQPDASPEPTPAKATPTPEAEESADDGGTSAGALAGIGLAGLLIGLVGGGLLARRT